MLGTGICVVVGAAGVVGDEEAFGGVERRQQLSGVENGQAPGRAGSEVVDVTAGPDRGDGAVDELGELGQDRGDRVGHRAVRLVQEGDDLERRRRVDPGRLRVAIFRGRAHPDVTDHSSRLVSYAVSVKNVNQ